MGENEIKVDLARLEERQKGLKEDIDAQANRIDKIDANIRWVVLAVLGVVIGAVMRLITAGQI